MSLEDDLAGRLFREHTGQPGWHPALHASHLTSHGCYRCEYQRKPCFRYRSSEERPRLLPEQHVEVDQTEPGRIDKDVMT